MFVRAVWRTRRLVELRQTQRGADTPNSRDSDPLGRGGPDFGKMTRGLFDR